MQFALHVLLLPLMGCEKGAAVLTHTAPPIVLLRHVVLPVGLVFKESHPHQLQMMVSEYPVN